MDPSLSVRASSARPRSHLTSSYLYTVGAVRHVLVEEVAVVLHVVCEEVGGGPDHEGVAVDGVVESAGGEAEHLLVDVEDAEVLLLLAHQPPRHGAHPLVRVVDKHLNNNVIM